MRHSNLASLAFIASLLMASRAEAQCVANATTISSTATPSITLCMQVRDVLMLGIDANGTSLGVPSLVNYGALATYATNATPLDATATRTVSVTANRPYEVAISSTQPTFGPSGVNKPVSDVQWRVGTGSYQSLSTTATSLGLAGTAGTASAALAFRSRWAFERDRPGVYSTTVVLTLSAR